MTEKQWWDASLEPKRNFRWEIQYTKNDEVLDGFETVLIPSHYITSVKMPSFSFTKEDTEEIGGRRVIVSPNPVFSPVEITFIDDEQNSVYEWLYWYFYNTGIQLDGSRINLEYGFYNYNGTYNFSRASNFFGSFKIFTLGAADGGTLGNSAIPPIEKLKREEVLSRDSTSGKLTYNYISPATGSGIFNDRGYQDRRKEMSENFLLQNTNTGKEPRSYRIDEIELVKPFIIDFKQNDLSYSDSGFVSYTIQINYASYKYSSYGNDRQQFNKKLKEKFGTPGSNSTSSGTGQSSTTIPTLGSTGDA